MAEKKPADNHPANKTTLFGLLSGLLLAVMAVAVMPTTLVLTVGLIPSAVAFFVDTSREKMLGPTVLALNLSGVLPAILKLWKQGHTMGAAVDILTQPIMLVLMLLSAGFGWLLFSYTPHFVGNILRRKAEARIRNLERYQEELIEEWGSAVASGSIKHDDHHHGGAQKSAAEKGQNQPSISA